MKFISSTPQNQLNEALGNKVMTFSRCKQCLVPVWLIFCKHWHLIKIETSLLFNPLLLLWVWAAPHPSHINSPRSSLNMCTHTAHFKGFPSRWLRGSGTKHSKFWGNPKKGGSFVSWWPLGYIHTTGTIKAARERTNSFNELRKDH